MIQTNQLTDNRKGQRPVIHIVDDDESLRTALMRLLRIANHEVRPYASAGEFLVARVEGPGCILLDVRMPGLSGLDLQEAMARSAEPLPIIFLTGHGDIPLSVRAIKAGAVDFLTKPVKREVLLKAVETAIARDAERRAAREQWRYLQTRFDALTLRERDVFERVVVGKLNKQIAAELGTAERTVKAHRARIMEKMDVRSIAELVQAAARLQGNPDIQPSRAQM